MSLISENREVFYLRPDQIRQGGRAQGWTRYIVLSVGDDDHGAPGIWPWIRWHPPLVTPRHDDTMSRWQPDQWPTDPTGTRDQNSSGELETDWGGGCKFCCVVLNIWAVQWPGVFHSRLLIIFRDFKLWRESDHRVESWCSAAECSEARDRSGERANNDYLHIGGHQPQLKQIRNLFKRPMIHSDFGTIEQLFYFCRRGLI